MTMNFIYTCIYIYENNASTRGSMNLRYYIVNKRKTLYWILAQNLHCFPKISTTHLTNEGTVLTLSPLLNNCKVIWYIYIYIYIYIYCLWIFIFQSESYNRPSLHAKSHKFSRVRNIITFATMLHFPPKSYRWITCLFLVKQQ